MRHPTSKALPLSSVLVAALLTAAFAGKYNKELDIGDRAPEWKNLIGVDLQNHSSSDLEEAKAAVVVFTCNHCPVATAYEDRLVQFAKDYAPKGVAVIAINVNNLRDDWLDKMKERAEKKGFSFPYVYDPTQRVARDFGTTVTPHWFVLDGSRKIAYMGAFDDNQDASNVKETYLRDAVDAVLAGKSPEVTETRQFGCGIKYEEK